MAHLLIIDDHKELAHALSMGLLSRGHTVEVASDGAEGLVACEKARPDVVITDALMPTMGGLETLAELRRRFPNIKVIVMSGSGEGSAEGYLETAMERGAAATLAKPFNLDTLVATLTAVLNS